MDAVLKDGWRYGKRPHEIAEVLGVTPHAVRARADRIGLRFAKLKTRRGKSSINRNAEGHKPFTERCGELLRAAGVRI
jgi:hypothetical protein